MRQRLTNLRTLRPLGMFLLAGVLTVALSGCGHSMAINYYSGHGYYNDVTPHYPYYSYGTPTYAQPYNQPLYYYYSYPHYHDRGFGEHEEHEHLYGGEHWAHQGHAWAGGQRYEHRDDDDGD